jgi:hypothetical protein
MDFAGDSYRRQLAGSWKLTVPLVDSLVAKVSWLARSALAVSR